MINELTEEISDIGTVISKYEMPRSDIVFYVYALRLRGLHVQRPDH
jgi:hypothetical protein